MVFTFYRGEHHGIAGDVAICYRIPCAFAVFLVRLCV